MGDSGVGKSCLILRYSQDEFVDEHNPTICVDWVSTFLLYVYTDATNSALLQHDDS